MPPKGMISSARPPIHKSTMIEATERTARISTRGVEEVEAVGRRVNQFDRDRIRQPTFEASKGEEVQQRIDTRRGHVRIFCQITGAVEIGRRVLARKPAGRQEMFEQIAGRAGIVGEIVGGVEELVRAATLRRAE